MKIVHLANSGNKFFFWGESSTELYPVCQDTAGKGLMRLPGQMALSELLDAIKSVSKSKIKINEYEIILWLPTAHNVPLYSSAMIHNQYAGDGKKELKPWLVQACEICDEYFLDLLSCTLHNEKIVPGVLAGKDIQFLGNILKIAVNLVTRHQFLPALYGCDGRYQAHWRPVVQGHVQETLKKLAEAVPPLLRLQVAGQTEPLVESSEQVAENMLYYMLDAIVRLANKSSGVRSFTAENVHNYFLDALCSRSPVVECSVKKTRPFEQVLQDWAKPVTMMYDAPFRLCFKLQEPGEDEQKSKKKKSGSSGSDWMLEFFLKAVDDPSLLIPLDKALKASGQIKKIFKDRNFNPHEYLLYAFGRASRVSSQVANSLQGAMPASCTISSTQVCDFLLHTVPALQDTGFDVIVPSWCASGKMTGSPIKVRAAVKSGGVSSGLLSMSTVLDFDWQVSLGDIELTFKELAAMAKLKEPFVNIRGKWVFIEPEMVSRAVALLNDTKKASVRDLFRWSIGGHESAFDAVEFEGVTRCPMVEQLLHSLEHKKPDASLKVEDSFVGTLRDYQFDGYAWLNYLYECKLGACLADDMGLGKTVQMLACIEHVWRTQKQRPSLLICPTSVTGNWYKEAAKFTPDLPIMIHHGSDRYKGEQFKNKVVKQALVVSSYALLHRDSVLFKDIEWNMLILDEAQNIKNAETKQTKAAKLLDADFRVALTGTPVENSVGDLWSIMDFLNPGFLGSHTYFKNRFMIPITVDKDEASVNRLQRITSPFILRRVKTDKNIIKDLPEKIETHVMCTLTKEQAALYKTVVDTVSKALNTTSEGIARKGLILSTLLKFKQICDHPSLFLKDGGSIAERSGKLERITEMLEEILANHERALIFTQFKEMGDILKNYFETTFGRETLFLHGGTAKKDRDAMVEYFQSDNGPSLFVLSLKAGGVGLNLTKAQHVFHFDRWWNPAVENQATDRAFRIGQTKNVQVHKFVTQGTLEERISDMIERKKELAQAIITSSEQWITNLSNKELHELFVLAKDALGD
jgi:SNF2 family DNA or RNA helicase